MTPSQLTTRVSLDLQRRRVLQGQLELLGVVLGVLPDGGQQMLNGGARRGLGQHLGQAVLDFGRDQAGAQEGRETLQGRNHESMDPAAALIQGHPAGAAPIGLIQPARHLDLAPQGHPFLVDHLLEAVDLTAVDHGVVGDFARLRQPLETDSTEVVQRLSQLAHLLAKVLRSGVRRLQPMLPLEDIFLQLGQASAKILRIFHLGPLSGFGRKCLHPKVHSCPDLGSPFSRKSA